MGFDVFHTPQTLLNHSRFLTVYPFCASFGLDNARQGAQAPSESDGPKLSDDKPFRFF